MLKKKEVVNGALSEFVWRYKIAGFEPPEREVEVQGVSHDSLFGAIQV